MSLRRALGLLAIVGGGCGDNIHPTTPTIDGAVVSVDAPVDAPTCTASTVHPVLDSVQSGDLILSATQAQNSIALTVPLDKTLLVTSMSEAEPSPYYGAVICELHDADLVNSIAAGITCRRGNFGTDSAASTGAITIHWTAATFTSGVTVQRGEVDTTVNNPSVVTLASSADPAKSFVVMGGNVTVGTGWGNNEFARASLLNATTLDIRNETSGSQIAWQVVTFEGANVQRGSVQLASTNTNTQVKVTPVPYGALPSITYTTDNTSGVAAAQMMARAALSNDELSINRDSAGTLLDVSWELVGLPVLARTQVTTFGAGEASKDVTLAGASATTDFAIASNQAILGSSSGSTAYAGSDLDLVGEGAVTLSVGNGVVHLSRASSTASATIAWTLVNASKDRCEAP